MTPRRCSDEGDRARSPEAGHSRSAGSGGRELTPAARLSRRRRACRPRGRSGGRLGRPSHSTRRGRADVRAAPRQPFDRELRDRARGYFVSKPRIAVVSFPGSNDDRDALHALEALGAEAVAAWHADEHLPDVAGGGLPRGVSIRGYLLWGGRSPLSPAVATVSQ